MNSALVTKVNRVEYEDGHFDKLETAIPVELLKYVDKYFRFNYTKVSNNKNKAFVEFFGLKDYGDEPYKVYLTVAIEPAFDMYCYELTVKQGFYNRCHETGFISHEGRFERLAHGNGYV